MKNMNFDLSLCNKRLAGISQEIVETGIDYACLTQKLMNACVESKILEKDRIQTELFLLNLTPPKKIAYLIISMLHEIKEQSNAIDYNVLQPFLENIKKTAFLCFPFGKTYQYNKFQRDDFVICSRVASQKTGPIIVNSAIPEEYPMNVLFDSRKSILEGILEILFLFDVNKGLSFYKKYKNIYDFKPIKLYLYIFRSEKAINGIDNGDVSIEDLQFIISELRSNVSYFDECFLENFKTAFRMFHKECASFYRFIDDKNIHNEKFKETVIKLIDFSKLSFDDFFNCSIKEEALLLLDDHFKNMYLDASAFEDKSLFGKFINEIYGAKLLSLLEHELINNRIYELIYLIKKDFGDYYVDCSETTISDAIDSCIDVLVRAISDYGKKLEWKSKVKLFNDVCNKAVQYATSGHLRYQCDKIHYLEDEHLKDKIYSIDKTLIANCELLNRIGNSDLILGIICSAEKTFQQILSNHDGFVLPFVADYSYLFIPLIKIIERYLKEYLVKNHANNIYRIDVNNRNAPEHINLPDHALTADDLSHGIKFELGPVSLAIQYVFNLDPSRINDYNIFTGLFFGDSGVVKFDKNQPRQSNAFKKATMCMPFDEFRSIIRNGYMHIDIVDNLDEAIEKYNAVCYWLIKCIETCGAI